MVNKWWRLAPACPLSTCSPGHPPRGCERASQSQPQVSAAPGVGVHPHITAAQGCRALSLHCTKALGP